MSIDLPIVPVPPVTSEPVALFDVPVGHLPISEMFGPTLQGEGRSVGRLAYFVRLGGCNLTCNMCDTKYTWDASQYDLRKELTNTLVGDIVAAVPEAVPLVVVTGGEPMLYQRRTAFTMMLGQLLDRGHRIEIETNGTIAPTRPMLDLAWRYPLAWNVSPKLDGPMSVDPEHRRIVPDALSAYATLARSDRAVLKVVCVRPADVATAADLARLYGWPPGSVWVMPAGRTEDAVLANGRAIADTAIEHGLNLTTRLHMLLWPKIDRGK